MKVFASRAEAGAQLAEALAAEPAVREASRLVVLAIPRGGLPVGVAVVDHLDAEFDVLVVRKLRAPHNPEMGYGAVGPDAHVELDEPLIERLGLSEEQVAREVEDRQAAVRQRLDMYRRVVPRVDLNGAVVVVVDDGIATGGTARQAVSLARRSGAQQVILAVPVAPKSVFDDLAAEVDEIIVLSTPAEFLSVGQAYHDYEQLDDEATLETLRSVAAKQ